MSEFKTLYNQYLKDFNSDLSFEDWLKYELRKTKEELAILKKKKKSNPTNKKKIQQLRPEDLSIFGEYDSITEASKLTGINRVSISKHLSNPKERKMAGGYVWRLKK